MIRVERTTRRRPRARQWALGIAITAWGAGLFLTPAALWRIGAIISHQRPERSFFIAAMQMPVCARCTGLYVGAALAVPLALLVASPLPGQRARWIFAAAALPTAITWTLEAGGALAFSNAARFAAALPWGAVAAWLVLAVLGEPDHQLRRSSV